jgi:tRNA pseudouridine38-40 synthase
VTPSGLKRFALVLHYDGAPFHGWQLQKEGATVQGTVEEALRRITGERRVVVGSGRTDRGVHASGQVASVILPERWEAVELRRAMNALLPRSVWVEEIRRVPDRFHPRYDALRRSYVYQLGLHRRARSPFLRGTCWPVDGNPPDADLLLEAAALVPGERSFRNFAKAGQPERGDRCRVDAAGWTPWAGPAIGVMDAPGTVGSGPEGPDGGRADASLGGGTAAEADALGLRFTITANRYLHHMVRYLVGTMVEVARGGRPLEEMAELLESPDTALVTSPPAPPEGLFLARVEYLPDAWGGDPDRDPA